MASLNIVSNTLNGIVLVNDGYSPNTYPNNNQTIKTTALALLGLLDLADNTFVAAGYFLSKSNLTFNDNKFILPTSDSVMAKQLWILSSGVIPDTLFNNSVQGDTNGLPTQYSDGQNVTVIPFPETGTFLLACVDFTSGDAITVNSLLYVTATGSLTVNPDNAVNSAYSVGYIVQSDFTSAPSTATYQMTIVISPNYILQEE